MGRSVTMNQPIIDAILNRRSYRTYQSKPVPQETLKAIAETAVQAPSANNRQPWKLVVVTDKAWLDKFDAGAIANFAKDRPGFDTNSKILKDAPAALVGIARLAGDVPPVPEFLCFQGVPSLSFGLYAAPTSASFTILPFRTWTFPPSASGSRFRSSRPRTSFTE